MTRAPLSVTVDDSSKVYGDENPTFAVRFDGFVLGQGAGVLGGELEVRHRGHHVQCRRRLRRRGVRAGERQLRHQVHRGTLEVTRAPLSVTVVDSSKVYGDENPTFTVTYKGVVLGQGAGVLGGELSTPPRPHVQCRRRLRRRGVRTGQRQLRHQLHGGTLKVTRAPLSVTAVDTTKVYGDENPAFTVEYDKFVLGARTTEVLGGELEYATEATTSSAVGGCRVAASGLASGNYAIRHTAGTLTVTKAPLSVTAANQSKVYGEDNPP